jgi:hypothetical protein
MNKLRTLILAVVALAFCLPAWPQSAPTAQQAQEPAWPQPFNVQGPLVQTFGFAVTQPGPIVVTVQAQGAPLNLSVEGPLPNPSPPIVQSGAGTLRISYTVTPQDLQRGMFWQFHVGLAQPSPPQFGGRANGSVTVLHPPVDQARVMQAMGVLIANQHRPAPAARAEAVAQARSQRSADFNAHVAQIAQRRAQSHAAIAAQLQPMLNDMRRQKALLQQPGSTSSPSDSDQVKSRGLVPLVPIKRLPLPPQITGFTVTHEQDPINLPPGSPQYGQPGDAVTITGTGFGSSDGELHFVIGPNPAQDIVALPGNALWLNTQIFSPVPSVSGFLPYSGAIYVKRLSDGAKSNFVPFQFEPDIEQREIQYLVDYVLAQISGSSVVARIPVGDVNIIYRDNENFFSGITGVDRFFINTKLQNGWTVAQQPITYIPVSGYGSCGYYQIDGCTGGQSWIQSSAVGTDLLSMNVGFSVNPRISGNSQYEYMVLIPIQGPSGIPDGQVCVTAPPPNTQCPSIN